MLQGASIKSVVRKLSISTGLYRPGIFSRVTDRNKLKRFREEGAFFSRLLEPKSLCFDVGANIGEVSETLLSVGMRVVAFEPQLGCVEELKARCRHYRERFVACQNAVGASPGEATLYTHKNTVVSSFRKDWWEGSDSSVNVPVTTLDKAISTYGRPSYCKIDVEGWELEVLKGLSQPIPLISLEYHFKEREMDNTLACLQQLARFGELRINITPAETLSFTFPEWLPLDQFLKSFPEFRDRPGYHYGDLFVRIAGAS